MTEYRFGFEEEFFIVDSVAMDTVRRLPERFVAACKKRLGRRLSTGLLQSQIELISPILSSVAAARDCITEQRTTAISLAASHGLALVAAGTHPSATWANQVATESPRYRVVSDELQMLTRRNLLCGLHIHVEVPNPARRVELMTRLQPYLPAFVALSSSSPFWQGQNTGLMSYRTIAYSELPRTGLPPAFGDAREYDDYVDLLEKSGAIPDASHIWWAIRPSLNQPTIELRVCDACTEPDDTLALASLFRCLVRRLFLDTTAGVPMNPASSPIVAENMWRACRESTSCSIIDVARRSAIPFSVWFEELVEWLGDDASALSVEADLQHLKAISARGTSAHQQIRVYDEARKRGKSRQGAVRDVVVSLRCGIAGRTPGRPSIRSDRPNVSA